MMRLFGLGLWLQLRLLLESELGMWPCVCYIQVYQVLHSYVVLFVSVEAVLYHGDRSDEMVVEQMSEVSLKKKKLSLEKVEKGLIFNLSP